MEDHGIWRTSRYSHDDYEQLKQLVEDFFIREKLYLRGRITIKDVSLVTGISQLRLHSLFGKDKHYATLNEYVNRRFRIPLACQQLREHPSYTVEAVARDSGFQNMKTFFTWFRAETKMTPREYREASLMSGEKENLILPPPPL